VRSRAAILVMAAAAGMSREASAQSWGILGPPAIEAVAALATSSDAPDDPFLFFDLATTVPIGSRFATIVRPYAHRLAGGDWEAEMYQLQLRYQSATRIPVRIDAGIISSPLGLGTLELKPDVSPTIKNPFYYFVPLPSFDSRRDGVQLISGGYPLGLIASASGARWDARGGITDSTPTRERDVFERDRPPAMRQFVAGGGVSPVAGLRVGVGFAQGAYRRPPGESERVSGQKDVTVFNVEAEYAVRYTRISGEWIRNRFDSDAEPAVARGYFVQIVQTVSPRLFTTARLVSASAPAFTALGRQRRTMTTAEITAGYRLRHDLTLRAGYYSQRRFTARDRTHMALASVVWSRRWF
jgi:hypothetical protein